MIASKAGDKETGDKRKEFQREAPLRYVEQLGTCCDGLWRVENLLIRCLNTYKHHRKRMITYRDEFNLLILGTVER